jgi:hypothetical protein
MTELKNKFSWKGEGIRSGDDRDLREVIKSQRKKHDTLG